MSRQPVTTAAELETFDPAEVLEGYLDGMSGDPEPGGNRSKGYWHGWRNAKNDREGKSDDAQRVLIASTKKARVL